ncbi:MAG TPA: FtsX-like permease family protein [Ornithinibacter sp.]|nr:FtsX-like permease family protein [Ornithinibacter sp.]
MTTLVRPDAPTEGTGGSGRPARPHEPSRYAAWRSSWAVALRMARRDVRRHRGRSALIVVMVTVPTLLLSALVTIAATSDVAGAELIAPTMGTGQAFLEGPSPTRIAQGATPSSGTAGFDDPAQPIPGFDPGAGPYANADAVSRLVGAPVVPMSTFAARTTVGERRVSLDAVALDGRTGLGDKLRLVSGRWPQGTTQALATAYGMSRGLPDSGPVTVTVDGTEHTLDVVGIASVYGSWGGEGLVVAEPLGETSGSGGWIVMGEDPVTWPEVRGLNDHGFQVTSAAVLRDPPSDSELAPEMQGNWSNEAQQTTIMVALGAVMLLIITALLVGPAFAVSAARQRRTLALAASNGASTAVLRRTVLASALVLGTASALLGVVLGVAAARGLIAWTNRDGLGITGPFDVRWALLAGIALCAMASTMVAALAPARRLGRLDIVGVMRGQSVSPRPSILLFVVGVVLAAAGAWAIFSSIAAGQVMYLGFGAEYLVTIGAVALILGALFLVPVTLTLVGRLGSRMPTSLRMAARDLARHRSRSAPSVAAVLAAVAGLTFGITGLSSDTAQREREYLPQTIAGEALVHPGSDALLSGATVAAAAPGLVVTDNLGVDTGDPWLRGEQPTEPFRMTFANLVPEGCTPERTVQDDEWLPADQAEADQGPPCSVAGTNGYNGMTVTLLAADEIVRRLGLDEAQARAVRAGGAVVRGLGAAGSSGTVRIARGTYAVDPAATGPVAPDVKVDQDVTVPVVAMPQTRDSAARMLAASMLLATDTATTRGWATVPQSFTVRDPSGAAVTGDAADTIQQTLGDEVFIGVERGFERDDVLIVAILLGVFALLILVITLTSTALTLAEQQSDQATLAALGATRGTRRVMAAAQAFLLAAVGCLLGVAVGLVPGIAISRPLTSQGWDPLTGAATSQGAIVVIPWQALLVVGVLVPLVAAGIAAAGIRRAPQVTRRAT